MEIHKPKPVHSWRELLTEIGVVVIGVCIALSAEQTVEAFHWQHKVRDVAQAMRLELRDDDGPQAYTRVAISACLDRQLDAIQSATGAGHSRQEIVSLIGAYRPPNRTWDTESWKVALASDIGSHVAADQMIEWSKPFRAMPELQTANAREHADWTALQPTGRAGERLAPSETDTVLAAVQRLREDNHDMSRFSNFILITLERFGANQLPEQQRHLLGELRAQYHDCVVVPSIEGIDPNDQLRDLHQK